MLFRAIAFSMALLIGIGTIVPLATNYAEAGPRHHAKHRKHKKYKKYSRAWWRQYHARMKRKRALQARKRALRLHQLRLARKAAGAKTAPINSKTKAVEVKVAMLPSGLPAPAGWKPGGQNGAEVRFRLENGNGVEVGDAAISVVGPATGDTVATGRNRSLAGVPTNALRREVINRMIAENGWVVNDFQKDVGGKTVYVVVAQSQVAGGRVQSRMFYFTEADGRIYSVATRTDASVAERMAAESEKVIQSLQAKPRPVQRAGAMQE